MKGTHAGQPKIQLRTCWRTLAVYFPFLFFLYIPFSLGYIAICHAAPPNPHLFFDMNPVTGEFRSKLPDSEGEFRRALEGCCFVRERAAPQADGVEYILGIKVDFLINREVAAAQR